MLFYDQLLEKFNIVAALATPIGARRKFTGVEHNENKHQKVC